MLTIYRFLLNTLIIFLPIIFLFRVLKKKENLKSIKEKIGLNSFKRKGGKLIWFHGASVGELQSIIPILEKFDKSNKVSQILVTSNTLSSSKVISNIKIKKIIHQFFPIDNTKIIKDFIEYWKPSIALFIDSEIWPNTIVNLKQKNIPTILINGRITKKSFTRWFRFKKFSNFIFSKLDLCLTSNKETIFFLKKLGAKKIRYYGNLKYAQSENEKIDIDNSTLKFFSKKKTWCASSTHNFEEKFVGKIHNRLKEKYKNLLTVIIPRHINREKEIINQLNALNLKVHCHEPKKKIATNTDIYLVNSFGKTKSFYSIIKNIFLGGSLIRHGGQNPLEAVRYNCNILHGPHVFNFKEIYDFLKKNKISKKIYNLDQTEKLLEKLFSSKKAKKNVKKIINNIGQKILNKSMKEIETILN